MKKKILTCICAFSLSASLIGCGQVTTPTPEAPTEDSTSTANTTEPQDTVEDSAQSGDNTEITSVLPITDDGMPTALLSPHDYTFTEEISYEEFEGENTYTRIYTIDLVNDKAILTQYYLSSSTNFSSNVYVGDINIDDTSIYFHHAAIEDTDSNESYVFTLEDGQIISAEYVTSDIELQNLAGTYTCPKSEYGPLLLEITSFGQTKLTLGNSKTYNANLILVNGKYDLMVYSEEDDINIDWYIYFSGTTFTYESYYYADYEPFAGSYTAFGNLGDIYFDVDEYGNVTTTCIIDNQSINFYGNIYIDQEMSIMTGMYLYSDEGYTLDLTLVDLGGEDGWNYSGYMTSPLGAG